MKLSKVEQREFEMFVYDEDDDKIFVCGNFNASRFTAYTDKKV